MIKLRSARLSNRTETENKYIKNLFETPKKSATFGKIDATVGPFLMRQLAVMLAAECAGPDELREEDVRRVQRPAKKSA